MKPMPDLNEFARLCHEASERKGWTNLNRTDSQTINLMVSENSEAVEDFRNKKGVNEIYYEFKSPEDHLVRDFKASDMAEWSEEDRCKAKPCGIPIELADTVIRIGQECGTHELDLRAALTMSYQRVADHRTDVNDAIADATMHIANAWKHSPRYIAPSTFADLAEEKRLYTMQLAMGLLSIMNFCRIAYIDLWACVEEKMAYNETRPMLHGGKAI